MFVVCHLMLTVIFKEGGVMPILLRRRLRFSKAIYPRSLTEQVTGRTSFEPSLVILKFKFLPRCQTARSYLPAYWSELSVFHEPVLQCSSPVAHFNNIIR